MHSQAALNSQTDNCWPQAWVDPAQDQRSFRDVLGRYPTGVVVVSAMTDEGPVGMAVNSFASVSLDPPLVSFCPMLTSRTWASIREVGSFAVSTLGAEHAGISRLFARKGAERFVQHEWAVSPAGHPVLATALSWVDATIKDVSLAGDHELVIAEATTWSQVDAGEPLVFFGGTYRNLAA